MVQQPESKIKNYNQEYESYCSKILREIEGEIEYHSLRVKELWKTQKNILLKWRWD